MSEHSPEPWQVKHENDGCDIEDSTGYPIAFIGYEDDPPNRDQVNARRIVAAVNACKGIPQAELEDVASRTTEDGGYLTLYGVDRLAARLADAERLLRVYCGGLGGYPPEVDIFLNEAKS